MHTDLVSIIIPVHNGADVIERSVHCASNQTVRDIEIIVVDDGSTDATAEILERLAGQDSRITVLRHPGNRGRLEARRTGLLAAKGDFVLFLDADDELAADAAARSLEAQAGRYDIVHFGFELRYQHFESAEQKAFDERFCQPPKATARGAGVTHIVFRDRRGPWSLCGKLMRTALLQEAVGHIPPSSMTQAEDACLYFIVSSLASSYRGIPGYRGYIYHIDIGGSDAKWTHMSLDRFAYSCRYIDAMECIHSYLLESGKWDSLKDDYLTVRREHLLAICSKLLNAVSPEERAQALDMLTGIWPVEEVMSCLADAGWERPADTVAHLAGAATLACPPHEMRTIAAFHNIMHTGGAELVVSRLFRLWHDMGYRTVMFAEEPRTACRHELPEDTEWVILPEAFGIPRNGYDERARILARAIHDHGVDALIYHQWWNPMLPWDMLTCQALDVPVITYCHSSFRMLFSEAHPWEFEQSRVLRHMNGLVVLSELDNQFWRDFNPDVWTTMNPMTIEPGSLPRAGLDGKDIIWVGRLTPFDKQPQEALKVFARVAGHDTGARLTMVGPAPNREDGKSLRELAQQLGIAERVTFAGDQADVIPYYSNSCIHLITSRFEGYCLVLAESKAMGIPCVMYELPHLTLTKGNRGIIAVPQGDDVAAARAIVGLLDDDAERRRLGQEAFEHIRELATFDHRVLWMRIFDRLSGGSTPRIGFESRDARWDMLMEACEESLGKARGSLKARLKQRARELAGSTWHGIVRRASRR